MRRLRLATFNIRWGVARDGGYALHATADLIDSLDADVVALQEVDRRYDARSRYDDQPALLADRLGLHATYAASVVRSRDDGPRGEYGIALLTRRPPDASTHVLLPAREGREQRSALSVRTDGVSVVCTHLEHADAGHRLQQATAVRDLLAGLEGPVALAGDLNDRPGSLVHELLTGDLEDALGGYPDLYDRPTFEHPAVGRLDHVLVGSALRVVDARIVDTTASDHSAVVVDVEAEVGLA